MQNAGHKILHVDMLFRQRFATHARECQKIVNQHSHAPCTAHDGLQITLRFRRQLVGSIFRQHAGVAIPQAIQALGQFKNVKRRMEIKGCVNGVTVYDDFAHHPTAIETTVAGLRQKVGATARILAVLEPRSNTMKLGTLKDALAGSLHAADSIYCYSADLGWDAAAALAPLGKLAQTFENLDDLVQAVCENAQLGDHILVMSNGSFGGIHQKLLTQLAQAVSATI